MPQTHEPGAVGEVDFHDLWALGHAHIEREVVDDDPARVSVFLSNVCRRGGVLAPRLTSPAIVAAWSDIDAVIAANAARDSSLRAADQ